MCDTMERHVRYKQVHVRKTVVGGGDGGCFGTNNTLLILLGGLSCSYTPSTDKFHRCTKHQAIDVSAICCLLEKSWVVSRLKIGTLFWKKNGELFTFYCHLHKTLVPHRIRSLVYCIKVVSVACNQSLYIYSSKCYKGYKQRINLGVASVRIF